MGKYDDINKSKSHFDYDSSIMDDMGNRTELWRNARNFLSECLSSRSNPLFNEAHAVDNEYWLYASDSTGEEAAMLDIVKFYQRNNNATPINWTRPCRYGTSQELGFDRELGFKLIENFAGITEVVGAMSGMIFKGSASDLYIKPLVGDLMLKASDGEDGYVELTVVYADDGSVGTTMHRIVGSVPNKSSEEVMREEIEEALKDLKGTALTARLAEIVRDNDK